MSQYFTLLVNVTTHLTELAEQLFVGQDDLKVGDGLFGKGLARRTDLCVGQKLSFALIAVDRTKNKGRVSEGCIDTNDHDVLINSRWEMPFGHHAATSH